MLRDLRPDPEDDDNVRKRRFATRALPTNVGGRTGVAGWLRATGGRAISRGSRNMGQREVQSYHHWFPMLHPTGRFRSVWNVAMAILIAYSVRRLTP